jgi:hypothetical protein
MTSRSSDNDAVRPGLSEAREELDVLEKLAYRVWAAISEYSKRPSFDRDTGEVELGIHESRQYQLKGYKELAHHVYGRTVAGDSIDEEQNTVKPFKFRITQANVSEVDCAVISRNSPIATRLVSADVGDEREINSEGTRYFKITEARTFEGPTSLHLAGESPDFRRMTILGRRLTGSLVISGLRAFVEGLSTARSSSDVQPSVTSKGFSDPSWIDDWSTINLSDSDSQSLNPEFFTRTTKSQEEALNKPRGLTIVEGIAGAGKTSVALGRLKFFSNFSTGENKEPYGLESAPTSDFSPAGMIGFVLSRSLRRYLEDTADELELDNLPIRDFQEHRIHLSNRFGLTRSFRRSEAIVPDCRTQLEWLRAIDAAVARSVASKFDEVIASNPQVAPSVAQATRRFSLELRKAVPQPRTAIFHLAGLAQNLVNSVLQAEYRGREENIRERSNKTEFRDRFDLERELRQAREEEERGVITPFVRQLLGSLAIENLFSDAVNLPEFSDLVGASFGDATRADIVQSIEEIRRVFVSKKDTDRRVLTDPDLLVLVTCAAMMADGFEHPNAPNHIYRVRRYTAIFIDEIQDFTEIEVFLMGMSAATKYHQITLAGDLCQRLQWSGSKTYDDLFPFVPRGNRNEPIFLDRNFRQRAPLARLSAGFRSLVQGDGRLKNVANGAPVLLHCHTSTTVIEKTILERITSVNEYATVAVIFANDQDAAKWYGRLSGELATGRRPASLSRREDLIGRFDIHFTPVFETKGLEFDVVVIPDLEAFNLESEIGRNQLYVAISRAKHALFLGCGSENPSKEISSLVENGFIRRIVIDQ